MINPYSFIKGADNKNNNNNNNNLCFLSQNTCPATHKKIDNSSFDSNAENERKKAVDKQ